MKPYTKDHLTDEAIHEGEYQMVKWIVISTKYYMYPQKSDTKTDARLGVLIILCVHFPCV